MKPLALSVGIICCAFYFSNCQPSGTFRISSKIFEQSDGRCPDSCASIKIEYPEIVGNAPGLKKSVNEWIENWVRDQSVFFEDSTDALEHMDFSRVGAEFINSWYDYVQLSPGGMPVFESQTTDTVLCNSPKCLTLRLDTYTFHGGAHPNFQTSIKNFEPATGQKIMSGQVIKDSKAILPMLEKKYLELKKEAFDNGFQFENGQIAFPQNWGYTEKGILFHYNAYEIAAYALGDADIFLTWDELGAAAVKL